MKLKIKNARLSFADVFTAQAKFGGDPKFSACFIVDKETDDGKATLAEFKKIAKQIEKEKFGGKDLPIDKLPIQDGNDKGYDGWENKLIISAANKKRPVIVGRKRQPVAEGDVDAPYSGCYVNAIIDLWGMDNQYGQRIVASLEAVQFAADGEPFVASTVNVDEDFDEIEVSADGGSASDIF
jgi:hypothetical protein